MKTSHWILIAGAAAFVAIVIAFKTGYLSRGPALVSGVICWGALRWIGIRTSHSTRLQRQQELEELKQKPVLRLDD